MVSGGVTIQNYFTFLDFRSSLGHLMIPDSHRNQRKNKGLKLAIMDQKIAQAGFKIKKWEIILNDNSSRDQKEPFLLLKMEKKGEKNFAALIL